MNADQPLTSDDQAPSRRDVSIRGNGNVMGDHNTVQVIYQGVNVTIPSPEAIVAHRRALLEGFQAQRDTQSERSLWDGVSHYIQEEGATLPIEASPYETGRLGAREGLLPALHAADRLLVLGGAGDGGAHLSVGG